VLAKTDFDVKVIRFAINHRPTYNIVGLISDVSEEVAIEISKIAVDDNPAPI